MTEIARLTAALRTITEKYLPAMVKAGNQPGILKWSLRAADFATRISVLAAPKLEPKEEADLDVPDPLSSDPTVAMAQILAATGHPLEFNESGATVAIDSSAVIADATPEQVRQLALLGFFGGDTSRSSVDWSLFLLGYDSDGAGNWAPKEQYANTGVWAAYVAGGLK